MNLRPVAHSEKIIGFRSKSPISADIYQLSCIPIYNSFFSINVCQNCALAIFKKGQKTRNKNLELNNVVINALKCCSVVLYFVSELIIMWVVRNASVT